MIYSRGSFAGQHCCCHRGLILGRNALKTSRNIDTSIKKIRRNQEKTQNSANIKLWTYEKMKNPRKKQLPGWFVTQLVFHLWRYGRHGQGTRNFSKPGSMANSNMLWCRQNIEWNHLAPLGYWSKGYSWSNKWWFKNILANSKTWSFIQTNSVSYQNILTTSKQSWTIGSSSFSLQLHFKLFVVWPWL